jgi:hypothetical protein
MDTIFWYLVGYTMGMLAWRFLTLVDMACHDD